MTLFLCISIMLLQITLRTHSRRAPTYHNTRRCIRVRCRQRFVAHAEVTFTHLDHGRHNSHRRRHHHPTGSRPCGLRTISWRCFKVQAVRTGQWWTRIQAVAFIDKWYITLREFSCHRMTRPSSLLCLFPSCRIFVLVDISSRLNPKQSSKGPLRPV